MKYLARYTYILEVEVEATDLVQAADIASGVDLFADTYGTAGVISTDVQYIERESLEEVK